MPSSSRSLGIVLGALAGVIGCDPFNTGFEDDEAPLLYRASQLSEVDVSPERLLLMTYNIKFGGGRLDFFFDCHGDDVLMNEAQVRAHLRALADKIKRVDPDVLLLQEVEINSKRSAYVHQVRWLLGHTALNYAAYASAWRADYVPSDGLGAVDMGNAVLSKYPITEAARIPLALIDEQSGLERYFYLKRNILRVRLQVDAEQDFTILNTHTSAFARDGTKLEQLRQLERELDALDEAGHRVVAGGDLNTLPPGSDENFDFPDSVCVDEDFQADDYRQEDSWLDPLYSKYAPAIDLGDYQRDNAPYFTHTTDKNGFWNRKLDYLFTNGEFSPGSALTHQDESSGGVATMLLSDHAPVSVVVELR